MSSSFQAMEKLDGDARALQIVRLDFEANRVVVDEDNIKIICENLNMTNADAVSIVAIMGTYRTGKSFLLDLLMRYLRLWESSVATETRKTEQKAEAFKKAEWDAKIHEHKSDDEARAAGHRAAAEAIKEFKDVHFPPPKNARWAMKGQAFPPPAWVHCNAAAAAGGDLQRESAGLGDGGSGFEWRGGMEKCTEGIWLWSRPFILPHDGRNVAVLLMDTQGAWDGQMTKEQCATIFGLTVLMASKCICNVQNMLTDDKFDAIDYFTSFAMAACSGMRSEEAPFGHLEFVVRDWPWYEKGMQTEQCKEMSQKHLEKMLSSNLAGRKETADRIREIFRKVSCFGLPHPGLGVLEPSFQGEFSEIGSDFFQLLDEFTRTFFDKGSFPLPSAPLGTEVTPSTFENVIKNFVEAFSSSGTTTVQLRDAFVNIEIYKNRDLLMDAFGKALKKLAPESSPIDPEKFEADGVRMITEYMKEFETKLRSFKLRNEAEQLENFKMAISGMYTKRKSDNDDELNAAQMKLAASPAVGFGVYCMTGHPYIDAGILAAVAYFQAKKRMVDLKKDSPMDVEVMTALATDVKNFVKQRIRDAQAISIAAQRCNPQMAMDQAKGVAMTAMAGAATAAHGAQEHNSAHVNGAATSSVNRNMPA